ncbi:hypothetical protein QBC34DRAFT_437865 [Podospora aff. communis PSN243]|uniref:Uncharacterized protein n=1 Tax=Podospora aff. communis PSN243 TaxID=3040156 RepID=A0AAV9GP93_9PEZI|nr:hypothetical protein QBC34DRAFT_437865 [Podospora aff. communis PSN243]
MEPLTRYHDVQGISPGDDGALEIDYKSPPEDTFRTVAESIITSSGNVDLLLLCSYGQWKKLHGWVPNFYHFSHRSGHLFRKFFDASGGCKPLFRLASVPDGPRTRRTLQVLGTRVDVVTETHRAMRKPLDWGAAAASSGFWQPKFDAWMKSIAEFIFPTQTEENYPSGGTLSEAVDWVLVAGMASGYGNMRRAVHVEAGDIPHWPLLELACREPGLSLTAEEPSFQDFLIRVGHMAVFKTDDGYLGVGDEDVFEGDAVVVLDGLNIPMVLRPLAAKPGVWHIVGACFVKGLMDGEGVQGK